MKQALLKPFKSNNLSLRNRVVMAPMTRCRADNPQNTPTEIHAIYYRQRASAGLIITEATQVSREGIGYINTPGIHSQAQVEGWKNVTGAVHKEGGIIFSQIWHCGRMSHPDFHDGKRPPAPSPINPNLDVFTPEGMKKTETPREMTISEIKSTISDYVRAAKNAFEAGFDGIEIHGANGYLLHQFFDASSNIRTDEYGGSIENRARILFEILENMSQAGVDLNKVGIRFNPSFHNMNGFTIGEETIPTYEYMVKRLNDYDLAYLHFCEPFMDVSSVPGAVSEVAKHFRSLYDGTLMVNRGFSRETGNAVIESGDADLVAFGVPFISNPDLVERFEKELPLAEADKNTFYVPGEKGYIDYPKAV